MGSAANKIIAICMAGSISLSPFFGKNDFLVAKHYRSQNDIAFHQVDEPQSSVSAIRTVDNELAILLTAYSSSPK